MAPFGYFRAYPFFFIGDYVTTYLNSDTLIVFGICNFVILKQDTPEIIDDLKNRAERFNVNVMQQTILGVNGQIGGEPAKELKKKLYLRDSD